MKTLLSSSVESCRGSVPSLCATQRFSLPERSLTKASIDPSGEYVGCESNGRPQTMHCAWPPAMLIRYRLPSNSKTIVFPSGDTSSDTQVPSCSSNCKCRAGARGSASPSSFTLPCCCAPRWRGVARDAARANATRVFIRFLIDAAEATDRCTRQDDSTGRERSRRTGVQHA